MEQVVHAMSIRAAITEDLSQVFALQEQWEAEDITYGYVAGNMVQLLAALAETFLLALEDDKILGYITASAHVSEGMAVIPADVTYLEIDDLYVIPTRRGQGIGKVLLDAVLARAAAAGIEYQLLYSSTKDIRRILSFYEESGFDSWYVQMYRKTVKHS